MIDKMQKLHNWSQLRLCTCPGLACLDQASSVLAANSGEDFLVGVECVIHRSPQVKPASSELVA